jgi:flagellar protein FlgJ
MPTPISKTASVLPIDPVGRHRSSSGPSRSGAETPVDPKLKTACDDMEALFIHHMLSEMRKTIPKSGLVDGGRAEEIYTSLMDVELAKNMASSGGLGLSTLLLEQMSGPAAAFRKKGPDR